MEMTRKRIQDVETLRAFAHPLRLRLLGSLRVDGPGTASELGRRFGESSGSTSYHLRQLARFGFVVEDEEQPSRRERRWRAAHHGTTWQAVDFLDDTAGREALGTLQREQLRTLVDGVQGWYAAQSQWPREWADELGHSDMHIRLSLPRLRALNEDILELLQRHAAEAAAGLVGDTPENAPAAEEPETVGVMFHVVSYPRDVER